MQTRMLDESGEIRYGATGSGHPRRRASSTKFDNLRAGFNTTVTTPPSPLGKVKAKARASMYELNPSQKKSLLETATEEEPASTEGTKKKKVVKKKKVRAQSLQVTSATDKAAIAAAASGVKTIKKKKASTATTKTDSPSKSASRLALEELEYGVQEPAARSSPQIGSVETGLAGKTRQQRRGSLLAMMSEADQGTAEIAKAKAEAAAQEEAATAGKKTKKRVIKRIIKKRIVKKAASTATSSTPATSEAPAAPAPPPGPDPKLVKAAIKIQALARRTDARVLRRYLTLQKRLAELPSQTEQELEEIKEGTERKKFAFRTKLMEKMEKAKQEGKSVEEAQMLIETLRGANAGLRAKNATMEEKIRGLVSEKLRIEKETKDQERMNEHLEAQIEETKAENDQWLMVDEKFQEKLAELEEEAFVKLLVGEFEHNVKGFYLELLHNLRDVVKVGKDPEIADIVAELASTLPEIKASSKEDSLGTAGTDSESHSDYDDYVAKGEDGGEDVEEIVEEIVEASYSSDEESDYSEEMDDSESSMQRSKIVAV